MRRLFPDPKVKRLYEDGFGKNDFLNRRQTGEALSNLLNRIEEPLVVALNSQWGSGKTWFLQRWVGEHDKANENSIVVYFDAFAHDYVSDPLPALVSELVGRTGDKELFKAIKEVAFKFVQAGVRLGAAVATSGMSEAGGAIANSVTGEAEKHLEEFWKLEESRSKAMKEFRTALESLVAGENGKKTIFVVDELDRCRPDYALEVLEVIKHFFLVDNVHFVLGVNLGALEKMVGTRYGADIEAGEYLQKFISIKLELPEVDKDEKQGDRNVSRYLDYLCRQMEVPEHLVKWLKTRIKLVSRANSVSLRQIDHIVSAVTLASREALNYDNYPWASVYGKNSGEGIYAVMVDLIIAKVVCPDLYPRFLDATITPDDLHSYLGNSDRLPKLHPEYLDTGQPSRENPKGIILEQDFDKEGWNWAFDTWLFISQIENETPVLGNVIRFRKLEIEQSLFSPTLKTNDLQVKELPRKIQREWLDLFRFYKPSSG